MTDSTTELRDCNIIDFIQLLNSSVKGKKLPQTTPINVDFDPPGELNTTLKLSLILKRVESLLGKHDPAQHTDCRFGNRAFSTWLDEVTELFDQLLDEFTINLGGLHGRAKAHFLNSFGNKQRLDFGTGHELEFVYFLLDLFQLQLIGPEDLDSVLVEMTCRYFELVRTILGRYNLEPAGSKGAWGIDDYQFLPFIFGSAQLINSDIDPSKCVEKQFVTTMRDDYLFMRAMEYKIQVKLKRLCSQMVRGVSVEIASPLIHNVLTSCTWEKINQGLFRLYVNDVQRLNEKRIVNSSQ